MKNIAYHIIDIVHNSVQAKSKLIEIALFEESKKDQLRLIIKDDGSGMNAEQLKTASDPYFTSRKTRHVGMGLALLKQNAEQCGGSFSIESEINKGTRVTAEFCISHIDCPALGDITGSIHSLITTVPDVEFIYHHQKDDKSFTLDTSEIKNVLEGVPLYHKEISAYLKEMIEENLKDIGAAPVTVLKHNN